MNAGQEEKTLLQGGRVFLEGKFLEANLYMQNGYIAKITTDLAEKEGWKVVNCRDYYVVPGYIDAHTHGRQGYDIMKVEQDTSIMPALSAKLASQGVTSFVPTLLSSSFTDYIEAVRALADYIEGQDGEGSEAVGIYSEGIFFSPLRAGSHDPTLLRLPTLNDMEILWNASKGHLKVVALAPELEGVLPCIHWLVDKGVRVTMAHSDANSVQTRAAIDAGITGATHVMNGMRSMHHLELGVSGVALCTDDIYCEVISDGFHLLPDFVRLIFRAKPADKVVLVTDNVWIAGLSQGSYRLGAMPVRNEGNRLVLDSEEVFSLAGSCISLPDAVKNAVNFSGLSPEKILPCVTSIPATWLGLEARKGALVPGMDADVNILSTQLDVIKTYVRGHAVN
jgi:N-acetylglucosamine-6-phosphate deacetylase